MKHTCFLFFLMFTSFSTGQLNTDFSSNKVDLSLDGWEGDVSKYSVSEKMYLQLNGIDETDVASLFRPSDVIDSATWKMSVYLNFNPSASNYVEIALVSDSATLISKGYYLKIGGVDDDVSLWFRDENSNVKIIDGRDGVLDSSEVDLEVKVHRSRLGEWQLYTGFEQGWFLEGSCIDIRNETSNYFGITCFYTKTRKDKFFFNDISISGYKHVDRTVPEIIDADVLNGRLIHILFSEPIKVTNDLALNIENESITIERDSVVDNELFLFLNNEMDSCTNSECQINGVEDISGNRMLNSKFVLSYENFHLVSSALIGLDSLKLTFNKTLSLNSTIKSLLNGSSLKQDAYVILDSMVSIDVSGKCQNKQFNELAISGLTDLFGDAFKDTSISFFYAYPERGDIVFSELMADPEPAVGLNDVEYIELFNRTEFLFNLLNCSITVNSQVFQTTDFTLEPYSFVIVSKKSLCVTNEIVATKFPTIINDKGEICLLNYLGQMIDYLKYDENRLKESFKSEGGWSYEKLDINQLSLDFANWDYSIDEHGGSPGYLNSVHVFLEDEMQPEVESLSFVNDFVISILFSESMTIGTLSDKNNYSINGWDVDFTIIVDSLTEQKVDIVFEAVIPFGQFELVLSELITDNAGQSLQTQCPLYFGCVLPPEKGDMVINEILFNSMEEDSEFIEFVNVSDKTICLSDLFLGKRGEECSIAKLVACSSSSPFVFPNDYIVLAENENALLLNHPEAAKCKIVEVADWMKLANNEGEILLCNKHGELLDSVIYSEKQHSFSIKNPTGVSLERISLSGDDWCSASFTSDYSSPTLVNSQFKNEINEVKHSISIDNELFTPNGDGVDDFLFFEYHFTDEGTVGTVKILDDKGVEVKVLVNNNLLGTSGQLVWYGEDNNNRRALPGIYIIWMEVFDEKGNVKRESEVCVLSAD